MDSDTRILSLPAHDADQLAEGSLGWDVEFVQVEAGALDSQLDVAFSPRLTLASERWGRHLHIRGASADGYTILLTRAGERGPPRANGMEVGPHQAVVFAPSTEFDFTPVRGSSILLMTVPATEFLEALEQQGVSGPEEGQVSTYTLPQARLRAFAASVSAATRASVADGEAFARRDLDIRQALLTQFASVVGGAADPQALAPNAATWAVREACALLRLRTWEPHSLAEVSELLGLSERTLRAYFLRVLNVSPSAYSRAVRLQEARRELLLLGRRGSTAPVADAAHAHGFRHLGRFSSYYQAMFDELPSETLRRSEARHAVADSG